jgi:hypothetical protein
MKTPKFNVKSFIRAYKNLKISHLYRTVPSTHLLKAAAGSWPPHGVELGVHNGWNNTHAGMASVLSGRLHTPVEIKSTNEASVWETQSGMEKVAVDKYFNAFFANGEIVFFSHIHSHIHKNRSCDL